MNKNFKLEREHLSKPGESILEQLSALKLNQAQLAERMGRTPSKINDLISAKESITVRTALQLENVLGVPADFWLASEISYREALARIEEEERLANWEQWALEHPLTDIRKCGYLKEGVSKVKQLLLFYGVASPDQWENMYVPTYIQTSYKKSEAFQASITAMTAWLRMGEIEMRRMQLPDYDKEAFKSAIRNIRNMVAHQPADFPKRIQKICNKAGVAVVFTRCLPKAPISGATRWVADNPLMQLTDRYKTNDHFWFTFYHEAAHIILHGKKEVFFEQKEYQPDIEKENEANAFAENWLLPKEFKNDLPLRITEDVISQLAEKYNTHPGVVVGRLQKMKKIEHWFGNKFKEKILLFEE